MEVVTGQPFLQWGTGPIMTEWAAQQPMTEWVTGPVSAG